MNNCEHCNKNAVNWTLYLQTEITGSKPVPFTDWHRISVCEACCVLIKTEHGGNIVRISYYLTLPNDCVFEISDLTPYFQGWKWREEYLTRKGVLSRFSRYCITNSTGYGLHHQYKFGNIPPITIPSTARKTLPDDLFEAMAAIVAMAKREFLGVAY